MKSKNNEIKITIGSVAKATFVIMTGYSIGKNLSKFATAFLETCADKVCEKIYERLCKKEEKEEKSDS